MLGMRQLGEVISEDMEWRGHFLASEAHPDLERRARRSPATNDKQSRYIEAAVNGIVVASLYAPNGNLQPGLKFDYKLAWLRRLSVR
jgi:exodeoxyribonuclease III